MDVGKGNHPPSTDLKTCLQDFEEGDRFQGWIQDFWLGVVGGMGCKNLHCIEKYNFAEQSEVIYLFIISECL